MEFACPLFSCPVGASKGTGENFILAGGEMGRLGILRAASESVVWLGNSGLRRLTGGRVSVSLGSLRLVRQNRRKPALIGCDQ